MAVLRTPAPVGTEILLGSEGFTPTASTPRALYPREALVTLVVTGAGVGVGVVLAA